MTLGERTNNRLESINSKVKSVCLKFVNLQRFFDHFFAVLSVLQNERDHNTIMAFVKKPVILDSEQDQFANLLTPYALQFVTKQQSLRKKVQILDQQNDLCKISSSEGNGFVMLISVLSFHVYIHIGTLSVTWNSCHCIFANTMQLPCRHMFAVRDVQKLSLYSEVGVANRWKLSYLKQVFRDKCTTVQDSSYEVH